jgi:hypothetical protein
MDTETIAICALVVSAIGAIGSISQTVGIFLMGRASVRVAQQTLKFELRRNRNQLYNRLRSLEGPAGNLLSEQYPCMLHRYAESADMQVMNAVDWACESSLDKKVLDALDVFTRKYFHAREISNNFWATHSETNNDVRETTLETLNKQLLLAHLEVRQAYRVIHELCIDI